MKITPACTEKSLLYDKLSRALNSLMTDSGIVCNDRGFIN